MMTPTADVALPTFPCPRCRARFDGRPEVCPRCRKWLGDYWPTQLPTRERVPWRFDLASIMLAIYLFGIGLGYALQPENQGLGLLVLLIGPASVVRISPILVHRRVRGSGRHYPDTLGVILESLLRVTVILAAAFVVLIVVFFGLTMLLYELFIIPKLLPLHEDRVALSAGLVAGSVFAVLMICLLGWRIYPPKD